MKEREALLVIEEMINSTKNDVKDNGFYYLIWGWLVFISSLTDYILLVGFNNDAHALVWGILMPLGGLISFVRGRMDVKNQRVKTYIDDTIKHLTIAFTVSIFIVCIIMPITNKHWQSFFPTLMVVYAFGVFVFGGILKSKPLIWGGIANWVCAILAFFFGYDVQLLLLATAVLLGFIIPGHILKARFKAHV
ncbi:MAG: hypothetical protein MUC81_02635 [Bacteroidia bacterium]|jgi:hypothetical protein|nr:hypothetical protein [Bacteroidia bacterium]